MAWRLVRCPLTRTASTKAARRILGITFKGKACLLERGACARAAIGQWATRWH